MLRLLRQWRWQKAVLGVLLFTVACAFLADWQWHRRVQVLSAIELVTANYDRAPVSLAGVLPEGSSLPRTAQWRQVRLQGTYVRNETVLVRNRNNADGSTGYLVLVPLRLREGRTVVVDRGWIPQGADAERPAEVPAPPRGRVTVVARLLPSEPTDTRPAPAGQVHAIDVPGSVRSAIAGFDTPTAVADAKNLITGAFGMRVRESPAPSTSLGNEAAPSTDEGPHLAYAVQWCLFAIGAWAFLVVHLRRQAYIEDVESGRRKPRTDVVVLDPRRRLRDEEIEDAQLDAAERAHQAALEARWVHALQEARSHREP